MTHADGVMLAVILLGVPVVLLFFLGWRNGRRGASWFLLAIRTCLGSLLLSWALIELLPVPLPAWYLVTLELPSAKTWKITPTRHLAWLWHRQPARIWSAEFSVGRCVRGKIQHERRHER